MFIYPAQSLYDKKYNLQSVPVQCVSMSLYKFRELHLHKHFCAYIQLLHVVPGLLP